MAENIILFGNGVTAQCVYKYFEVNTAYNFLGYCIDDEYLKTSRQLLGLPVLNFTEATEKFSGDAKIVVCVGYSSMNMDRESITKRCQLAGWTCGNLIPEDKVAFINSVGVGNILMPGAEVQPFVSIGDGNIIWPGSTIGHNSTVGSFVWVAANAAVGGQCKIGDRSFLGMSSVVSNGVRIARDNFVDAHTNLKKCTSDGQVFLGNSSLPAPMKSKTFSKLTKLGC